jgi:hypothetical protein
MQAVSIIAESNNRQGFTPDAESPNDPKLSDTRSRRGPCRLGAKVVGWCEAWAVTAERVRCSALWLGRVGGE